MSAKPTSGSWHPATEQEAPGAVGLILCDSGGGSIANFTPPGPWMSIDEAKANCRVAAAGKSLLIVCQALEAHLRDAQKAKADPEGHAAEGHAIRLQMNVAIATAIGAA